ncbi:hypothetical protein DFH11DRAFT_608019 [Phellopilus nigrolimitatus]|nr:hypothetical protein DFH11DRAFT_608019 [Phellopilus nigrolimitatus]
MANTCLPSPSMPAFRKSRSSKNNLLPYLKSASSKLSMSPFSSTSSLTAFFSSSPSSTSSKSVFMSGISRIISGKEKENDSPTTARSKAAGSPGDKARKPGMYPEISAPQLSPEALEAVRARFTLVPIANVEADVEAEHEEEAAGIRKPHTCIAVPAIQLA